VLCGVTPSNDSGSESPICDLKSLLSSLQASHSRPSKWSAEQSLQSSKASPMQAFRCGLVKASLLHSCRDKQDESLFLFARFFAMAVV